MFVLWKSRPETSQCQHASPYGLVVKILAFGYKGRGFESPHVHFHTGDPAICNTQSTPSPQLTSINKDFPQASHSRATCSLLSNLDAWGELCGNPDLKHPNIKTPLRSNG